MEELFKTIAGYAAVAIEASAVLLITIGAAEALLHVLAPGVQASIISWNQARSLDALCPLAHAGVGVRTWRRRHPHRHIPTWSDIGPLGAIATIRTVLNYFLEKRYRKV